MTVWAVITQAGIDERWRIYFKDAKQVQEIINHWQANTQSGNVALLQVATQYGALFNKLICKGGASALHEPIIGIEHPITNEKITLSLEQIITLVDLSNIIAAIDLKENKDNKLILEFARRWHLANLFYGLKNPENKLAGEILKAAIDRVLKANNLKLDDKQIGAALWRDEKFAKAVSDEIQKILGSIIKDKILPELDEQLKENACPDKKEEEADEEEFEDSDIDLTVNSSQIQTSSSSLPVEPLPSTNSVEPLSVIFPAPVYLAPAPVSPGTTAEPIPLTFQSFRSL